MVLPLLGGPRSATRSPDLGQPYSGGVGTTYREAFVSDWGIHMVALGRRTFSLGRGEGGPFSNCIAPAKGEIELSPRFPSAGSDRGQTVETGMADKRRLSW